MVEFKIRILMEETNAHQKIRSSNYINKGLIYNDIKGAKV